MTALERKQARRELREGLDIKKLAKSIGYAESTVRGVLSSGDASYKLAFRLARALGCPMGLFL